MNPTDAITVIKNQQQTIQDLVKNNHDMYLKIQELSLLTNQTDIAFEKKLTNDTVTKEEHATPSTSVFQKNMTLDDFIETKTPEDQKVQFSNPVVTKEQIIPPTPPLNKTEPECKVTIPEE